MAKICIVVGEGTGGFEPGDVAFCKDDSAIWGSAILNNPKFKLIEIPGLSGAEATEYFCASQPGDARENPDLKKRAVGIDVQRMERGEQRGNFERLTLDKIQAVRSVKPVPSIRGVV